MSENGNELVRHYLENAIGAETTSEPQLRRFSEDGDDEEVQIAFSLHADETGLQRERLSARLSELGGAPSGAGSGAASALEAVPRATQNGHIPEERIARNLVVAYSVEMGECARYEALAIVAGAVGDATTEELARQIQGEERQMADKIWHFLPSRSKIAFNMLTVNEVDPAVETKTGENRLVEG